MRMDSSLPEAPERTPRALIRQRWGELRPLMEGALARPSGERAAWIRTQCSDETLIAALDTLLADAGEEEAPAEPATLPHQIGRYRVLRELGRGGMGVVYLAEQATPRRLVAIKRLALAGQPGLRARFAREGELLARLAHPGIAQVIEADVDGDGHPYLAMEYIEGVDLARHAAGLTRTQRLELLSRIADAVEHAHARGVVHRDLKPGNILVTAEGQPKVLDFGIGQELGVSSTLTQTGALLGTPAYMSPEQAAGEGAADARSDVYALGVIGYELLVDRLPLPVSGLTPLEALRVVGNDTPLPLARHDPSLRGDLDTVIGTALARERRLRYASAGAFADDLRRVLAHEPIHARRPGAWQRLRLYARRKPALVGALALALASLLVGTGVALRYAWVADAERARAQAALETSQGTLAALSRVLSAGNPVLAGTPEVAFREVLAAAPALLDEVPPAARLPVLYRLALAQAQIGDNAAAVASFEHVIELAERQGERALWAQAQWRRLQLSLPLVSRRNLATQGEALLSDARLAGQQALVGIQLLTASAHSDMGRERRTAELLSAAERVWAAAPATPTPDDPSLAAEIEIDLLIARLEGVTRALPGSPTLPDFLTRLREATQRLAPAFPAEHPQRLRLETLADGLPDAYAGGAGWRARVAQAIERDRARLGLTHPAILARLDAADIVLLATMSVDETLPQLALESARALPEGTRQRLRRLIMRTGWADTNPRFSPRADEVQAAMQPICSHTQRMDDDCIIAQFDRANLLAAEGRHAESLALLTRLAAEFGQDAGLVRVWTHASLAHAHSRSGRAEEAAAHAERAATLMLESADLFEPTRDVGLMRVAWSLRPQRCDRVLEWIEPRAERLASYPGTPGDVLARLLATCDVRVGRPVAQALARLAPWVEAARKPGIDPWVRFEMVNAHLEIYHLAGDHAGFAEWAEVLAQLQRDGLALDPTLVRRSPWLQRAGAGADTAGAEVGARSTR